LEERYEVTAPASTGAPREQWRWSWARALFVIASLCVVAGTARDHPAWANAERRIDLETRPGVTQSFYLAEPDAPARATLLLFAGGEGVLKELKPPDLAHGNFLVRARGLFLAEGFAVAVIDVPSDHAGGLGDFRFRAEHADDIAAVVTWLRHNPSNPERTMPVWLVGTSRGTLSAANAAVRVPGVAGLVLTSTVMREPGRQAGGRQFGSIFTIPLAELRMPVLVVHHRADACAACPFDDTAALMQRFSAAPVAELIPVEGGTPPRSGPCEALSAHGYLGIEAPVVAAIGAWIRAH